MTPSPASSSSGTSLSAIVPGIQDAEFYRLRDFIRVHTGISLSEHKRALVCARLARRLRHHNLDNYTDYYKLLTEADPDGIELSEMINAITTNKTGFFREFHHFEFLTQVVFPAWRAGRQRRFRIWSAATSTGEEPYSLAMTILESFPDIADWDIRILATDIDTVVLAHAEQGVYTLNHLEGVSDMRVRRHFLRGRGDMEGLAMVKPALRDLIRFRRLNLVENSWPIRGPLDLVFCRNVLIYFDKDTQERLFVRFADLMRDGGHLMLGHAEYIHGYERLFTSVRHSTFLRRERGRA